MRLMCLSRTAKSSAKKRNKKTLGIPLGRYSFFNVKALTEKSFLVYNLINHKKGCIYEKSDRK